MEIVTPRGLRTGKKYVVNTHILVMDFISRTLNTLTEEFIPVVDQISQLTLSCVLEVNDFIVNFCIG